jgi:hypothetical protein
VIETGHPGRRRDRDAELLPETVTRELKLFDPGSEHVLDDHESRMRRHHETLRRDQSV